MHFSASLCSSKWCYCLVSSSDSQGTEYLKLYSSVLLYFTETNKYVFFCTLTLGRCSVPGDMGVVLVLWQCDRFSAGGLSDVSLAKYCPQYLLTDFPRAHVFTNTRLTQEHHQGDVWKRVPGINVIMASIILYLRISIHIYISSRSCQHLSS